MQNTIWREKIRWPWWLALLILGLDFSIIIAIWAGLGNLPALISVGTTLTFTVYFYFASTLQINVASNTLAVGRAAIEKKYLGEITTLDADEFRFLRGAGIDPSAFHACRFWIKRGVKIELNDSRDPTPYWLLSSKQPEKLVEALQN